MSTGSWWQLGYLAAATGWMAATHYRWIDQFGEMTLIGRERWWQFSYRTAYAIYLAGYGLAWPLTAPLSGARALHAHRRRTAAAHRT